MLAGLLKFILGFLLAIAILMGGGFATALYFMNRISAPPSKPIFANDNLELKAQSPKYQNQVSKATVNSSSQASIEESPSPTPSSTETPKETSQTEEILKNEESAEPLPPGAYRARVTWQEGLIVRKEPTPDAERIGGVDFNQKVIVLEQSSDQAWQKISLENGKQEGWIKAGNIEKVDEQEVLEITEETEPTE